MGSSHVNFRGTLLGRQGRPIRPTNHLSQRPFPRGFADAGLHPWHRWPSENLSSIRLFQQFYAPRLILMVPFRVFVGGLPLPQAPFGYRTSIVPLSVGKLSENTGASSQNENHHLEVHGLCLQVHSTVFLLPTVHIVSRQVRTIRIAPRGPPSMDISCARNYRWRDY